MRMWQGAVGRAEVECMVSPAYVVLAPKKGVSSAFFDYWFQHPRMRHLLGAYSHGLTSDRLRLYPDDFAQIPISLPSPEEQERIAYAIETVDRKIALLDEEHAAMTAYRAAVSERLFRQEVRFLRDDGTAFRDWEATTLGRSTRWTSGGTPSKDDPSYWDGEIPWISASAMYDSIIYDAPHKVSSKAIGQGTRLAPSGSILLLVRGMMLRRRVPICRAGRDVAFNQDVKRIVPSADNDPEFIFYLLKANEGALMALISATNVGTAKLDTDQVMGLMIRLPEPAEQRQIASALAVLDAKVGAIAADAELMRTFRRGLIDRLFP